MYTTIATHQTFEIPKIKWSRFIGNIFHIKNKEEADHFIHEIQQKYPDARHHCFAYRYDIQMNFDIFGSAVFTCKHNKVSDDSEPTNTAGKPIMNMIEKHNLHNILIVVTRYFGGTLLGVGWLIQAYTQAAKQVIEHATISEEEIIKTISFAYPFDWTQTVRHLISKYQAKIINEQYNEDASLTIEINTGYYENFKKELLESSKGEIKI